MFHHREFIRQVRVANYATAQQARSGIAQPVDVVDDAASAGAEVGEAEAIRLVDAMPVEGESFYNSLNEFQTVRSIPTSHSRASS